MFWPTFRIACILQMLLSVYLLLRGTITLFVDLVAGSVAGFFLYLFAFLLSIFSISLYSTHYPDVPVTGKQKTRFNRLFMINFIFLIVLFAKITVAYQYVSIMKDLFIVGFFSLPFEHYTNLLLHVVLLFFQFLLFYGLYRLRTELYRNFRSKEFEFESGG